MSVLKLVEIMVNMTLSVVLVVLPPALLVWMVPWLMSPPYITLNVPLSISLVNAGMMDPKTPLLNELGLPSSRLCTVPIPLLMARRVVIMWLVSDLTPGTLSTKLAQCAGKYVGTRVGYAVERDENVVRAGQSRDTIEI